MATKTWPYPASLSEWIPQTNALRDEVARLRELLADLRAYTAELEDRYSLYVISRPYMAQMPDGVEELRKRLDAELGPFASAALAGPEEEASGG